MSDLKKDISFSMLLLMINLITQGFVSSATGTYDYVVYWLILAVIAIGVANNYKYVEKKATTYALIAGVVILLTVTLTLSAMGNINIYDIGYGIIWVVTITAYITALSRPVLSMIILNVSELLTFLIQLCGGVTVNESLNSLGGLWIMSLIALGIYVKLARSGLEKNKKDKNNIKDIVLFEKDAYRIKPWVQIVIWSIIVSSVMYMAKNQMYEAMNSDIRYAVLASASVTVTTFLTISAITTSQFMIQMFAVYTIMEWYVISLSVFIADSNVTVQLLTVLVDTLILIYMGLKYKKQIKKHSVQKEVKLE